MSPECAEDILATAEDRGGSPKSGVLGPSAMGGGAARADRRDADVCCAVARMSNTEMRPPSDAAVM